MNNFVNAYVTSVGADSLSAVDIPTPAHPTLAGSVKGEYRVNDYVHLQEF